jgi:hypothetical protein
LATTDVLVDILDLEKTLQESFKPKQQVHDLPSGRATRGVNISSTYMDLLPKETRERIQGDQNKADEADESIPSSEVRQATACKYSAY